MRRRSVTLGSLAGLVLPLLVLVPVACAWEEGREQVPAEVVTGRALDENRDLAARLATRRELPASRASFEEAGDRIIPKGTRRQRAVSLGTTGDQPFELAHPTSGVSIGVALLGASGAPAQAAAGYLVYPESYLGADALLRPTEGGIEDYVIFESAPAEPRVRYELSLSPGVAGLRLVEGVLELLDAQGAPRLRMSKANIVDASGQRHAAQIAISGCAFDQSPVAPWRRPPTPPGARTCIVETSWSDDVTYPAVLDPSWTVTDALETARHMAMTVRLPDGTILVAGGVLDTPLGGGCSGSHVDTVELFDPNSETWATTGSLMYVHTDSHAALLTDGTVLVAGGNSYATPDPPSDHEAEIYDPDDGVFVSAGAPSAARGLAALAALPDGTALLLGGYIGPDLTATSERFTPPSSWAPSGDLDAARHNPTAFTLSTGLLLVAGGGDAINQALSSAELYSPGSGAFTPTDSMSLADSRFDAFELRGQAILVPRTWGGMVQLFDVDDETFSDGQPTPFAGRTTGIPGGALRVSHDDGAASVYDLLTNSWFDVGSTDFTSRRLNFSLLAIDAGRVLIAGGSNLPPSDQLCALVESEILTLTANGESCDVGAECASGYCEESLCATPTAGSGGAGGDNAGGAGGQTAGAGGVGGANDAGGEGGTNDGSAGQTNSAGGTGSGGAPSSAGDGGVPGSAGDGGMPGSGSGGRASGSAGEPNEATGGAASDGGAGGSVEKTGSSDDGGCGCRLVAPQPHRSTSLAFFALSLVWLARRRAAPRFRLMGRYPL